MSGIFRFKQFEADQSGCSMKINTDGVLLGAMARADKPQRILDIGTGTGVIALMLAQRFPDAMVDAVEIDPRAAETARRNFSQSPFASRLTCHPLGLSDFVPEAPYDLIVSNPPYFLDALKNPDRRKSIARHTDWSFFGFLLAFSHQWLTADGSLQLVLPVPLANELNSRATHEYGFVRQWQAAIHSFHGEPAIRNIVALGKTAARTAETEAFIIYESKGRYSEAYRSLLKDFFLAF